MTDSVSSFFGRLKILVVEDSSEMRRLVVALLESMGIGEIVEAYDGRSGLAAFTAHAPDLVITDGAMAPMNGYEMTRRIRNACDPSDAKPAVPILMISGHLGQATVDQARIDGVTDYLAKPLTAELLYDRVLAALTEEHTILTKEGYVGPAPRRSLTVHAAQNDELRAAATRSPRRETARSSD